jgi:hypothetical protein
MEAEDNRRGSKTMTDEERQKLCENLRDRNNVAYQDCEDAALEIERLAEENRKLANHCEHLRSDVIRLGKEKRRKT